ncbi:hypothetical protein CI109_105560 [Kwoniella shandongensis]|uniref:Plus3 domain-containing protein n=1 Tax=Kwoniella shandongensis TaxID=1734106 RepID=A0AAJ8LNI1_9TREE
MSDLENELLGLAEDDPTRRPSKKRHNSSDKKKKSKAFMDSDDDGEADMDLDSDDDEPGSSKARGPVRNPYPLEGKLEALPEIERENILAGRLEEMQKFKDSQALDAMFQTLQGDEDDDEPSRKRRVESDERFEEQAKGKGRARSEKEDGEISHSYRRSPERYSPERKVASPKKESTDLDGVPANRQELNSARLSRYELVDIMYRDGFEGVVTGVDTSERFGSYSIEYKGRNVRDGRGLLCQYGKATRLFRIADVSNGDFEERSELKKKHEEIKALRDRPMSDITSRQARDSNFNRSAHLKIQQLINTRDLAQRRNDQATVDRLNSEIVKLGGDPVTGQLVGGGEAEDDYDLRIQRINENNKKKTKESMIKAHTAALARKKAEEAIIKAKGVVSEPVVEPVVPPASGLKKGETPQQYVARTIDLDLGDF